MYKINEIYSTCLIISMQLPYSFHDAISDLLVIVFTLVLVNQCVLQAYSLMSTFPIHYITTAESY